MSKSPHTDLRNLTCPMHVIAVREALNKVSVGQEITLLVNRAGIETDLQALCRQTGNTLLGKETRDGVAWIRIRKELS